MSIPATPTAALSSHDAAYLWLIDRCNRLVEFANG